MKVYAKISEYYFSSGMYPYLYIGNKVNIAFMFGGGNVKKHEINTPKHYHQQNCIEYNFVGEIIDKYEQMPDRFIIIICSADNLNFYGICGSENNFKIGDKVYGNGELILDPGGFINEENSENLYYNFSIKEIKKINYSDLSLRYKYPVAKLLIDKKAFIEVVNDTNKEDFVDYIIGLDDEEVKNIIIPKTITD